MITLSRDLHRVLEKAVRKARAIPEVDAVKALESLAFGRREPWESMTPDGRALCNRLRVHGRQFGDRRDPRSGIQETNHLVRECAYEHWHRMLFARFLAEAGLLIGPETGVAVTLDEAKELARDRNGDRLTLGVRAVDMALIALHRSRHLSATLNGAAIAPGGLDQNRIAKAAFRVERAVLSVRDRIALRKLFQAADVSCKSGEEERAGSFLERLAELAGSAGGAPPLPASSGTTDIEDVSRLAGNERLAAIRGKADEWEGRIGEWRTAAQVIAARSPVWRPVDRLAAHAEGIDEAGPQLPEVAATREGRQLLADADPAAGVRKTLADLLRAPVRSGSEALEAAFAEAMPALDANEAWCKVGPADREAILKETGLVAPAKLAGVRAEIDAVPVRAARAVERAARLLEPKVRPVALERATLPDATEVEAWAERQKKALPEAVGDGPVLVG